MRAVRVSAVGLALAALLLSGCSGQETSAPTSSSAGSSSPSLVPAPDSGESSASALPVECGDQVNLTLVLVDGVPTGTGAVLVAAPDEMVRIVVESNQPAVLSVVGTAVSADVAAGEGLSLCAAFPRGRFPIVIDAVPVASIDTSDLP